MDMFNFGGSVDLLSLLLDGFFVGTLHRRPPCDEKLEAIDKAREQARGAVGRVEAACTRVMRNVRRAHRAVDSAAAAAGYSGGNNNNNNSTLNTNTTKSSIYSSSNNNHNYNNNNNNSSSKGSSCMSGQGSVAAFKAAVDCVEVMDAGVRRLLNLKRQIQEIGNNTDNYKKYNILAEARKAEALAARAEEEANEVKRHAEKVVELFEAIRAAHLAQVE